jgi:hypothetical protein
MTSPPAGNTQPRVGAEKLTALKNNVNPFLFLARISILLEGSEVDFVVDDKAFDKARFTRKICRERIPGRNPSASSASSP